MNWGYPAKRWKIWDQKWASEKIGPDEILSLSQEKVKVGCWWFGGSEVNYQLHFRSTRLKPRDFIWMDSVEPKEQRPLLKNERTLLRVRRQSSHYSGKSSIGVGWSVGQNKSFSKNSKTNFGFNHNELGALCQDMKNLGPKMSESFGGC